MMCRVCSAPLSPWGATGGIPLLKCRMCGSIHADCEKPSEDMYAGLYSKDEVVPDVVNDSLDVVARSMRPFRTHGRWLDIGFGQGALLDAASREGWLCHGTELSEVALKKGSVRGFKTTATSEHFEDESFDVVSLVELLEHVEDPRAFLREARRVLRKGGCMYVTTPNAWSLNRWILGASWSIFAPPDHVTIFTPHSLGRILKDCGFERIALRAEGLNPFEILRRALAKKDGEFHRVNAGTSLCQSLAASPGRRRLKSFVNQILTATRLGDSLKVRAQ